MQPVNTRLKYSENGEVERSKKYWVEKTHHDANKRVVPMPVAFFDTKDKTKSYVLSLELKDYIEKRGANKDL